MDIARFPERKGGHSVMEFGPIPEGRVDHLSAIVRASGCATITGKRRSCSSDYSDVSAC